MARTNELSDPGFFAEFPHNLGIRFLAPGEIRPTPEQRDGYRKYTQMGDPLADAVVEMFRRLPTGQGRRMFEIALERGIDAVPDAPAELKAFFAQVDSKPYWLDQDKLDHAARVSGRVGPWALTLVLSMMSLNGGYLASRADKVLIGTGNLSAENMAPRRVAETTVWWYDVTKPGGLGRFESGFKNSLRVRIMHAQVRAGMNRRPDWNYAEWDRPINQSLLVGTLLLFSWAVIIGCQVLGLQFSKKEKDSLYHLWRYVGHLLGVDPELVPAGEADAWKLMWLQADYEFLPDEDSRTLSQALVGATGEIYGITGNDLRSRLLRYAVIRYETSYGRIMLGTKNSDFLGMPRNRFFMAAVLATSALNAVAEVPRRLIPGATGVSERAGRRVTERLVQRVTRTNNPDRSYARHDRLAEKHVA
ncbi:DUF2236 domain-containing protein [Nocardia huaxiensis]|uniref:DUF2236 domain-containing protein n=1 Tax=Nocardia huaxiensis TaxID=2755382 RepID=A0A7D6ZGV2_9NOCA|nr:oxygenase MpaB family protein [Nocardia huaxiensis]QLY30579.1 DUF2236 domain-containing protein [Nocardia huaxiensis]